MVGASGPSSHSHSGGQSGSSQLHGESVVESISAVVASGSSVDTEPVVWSFSSISVDTGVVCASPVVVSSFVSQEQFSGDPG